MAHTDGPQFGRAVDAWREDDAEGAHSRVLVSVGSRHLSDDLLISCILVDDSGGDVAAMVKSICPDSEIEPDPEVLERRLFRSLEKRGPAAAQEGWRLSTKEEQEKRRRRSVPEDAEDEEGRPRRGRSSCDLGAGEGKDPGKNAEGSHMKRLYTPYQLRSVLQLMGLKQLRAHEVTRLAFEKLGQLCLSLEHTWSSAAAAAAAQPGPAAGTRDGPPMPTGVGAGGEQRTVSLKRRQFIMLLTLALALADRCRKKHVQDFVMACAIREHRRGMIILFGGTSGCGKSTLASLTASRLGITTVLSTDFVRHMLRRETSKEESPILYASTYNAGEALPAAEQPPDPKACILQVYVYIYMYIYIYT